MDVEDQEGDGTTLAKKFGDQNSFLAAFGVQTAAIALLFQISTSFSKLVTAVVMMIGLILFSVMWAKRQKGSSSFMA